MRNGILFLLQVVLLSCLLGLAVDVVTANVAVEYFTVHHPHVVDSQSPWVMALVWGVGASWWFGLIAGVLLWWVNLRRPQPLSRARIVRMLLPALGAIWLLMMSVLVAVYFLALMVPPSKRGPSFESDRRIMGVAMAHEGEYVLGAIATVVLMVRIHRVRV